MPQAAKQTKFEIFGVDQIHKGLKYQCRLCSGDQNDIYEQTQMVHRSMPVSFGAQSRKANKI